jgi:hypothetical protein
MTHFNSWLSVYLIHFNSQESGFNFSRSNMELVCTITETTHKLLRQEKRVILPFQANVFQLISESIKIKHTV